MLWRFSTRLCEWLRFISCILMQIQWICVFISTWVTKNIFIMHCWSLSTIRNNVLFVFQMARVIMCRWWEFFIVLVLGNWIFLSQRVSCTQLLHFPCNVIKNSRWIFRKCGIWSVSNTKFIGGSTNWLIDYILSNSWEFSLFIMRRVWSRLFCEGILSSMLSLAKYLLNLTSSG